MDNEVFKTDNVYLAAFLAVRRMERLTYSVDENGRYTFIFADHDTCDQLRSQYELTEVQISMPDFIMHVNRLRDIIFGGHRRKQI